MPVLKKVGIVISAIIALVVAVLQFEGKMTDAPVIIEDVTEIVTDAAEQMKELDSTVSK